MTSRLAKHLTLVFTGNIFAAFLGFLAVLIISRQLTVSDFGLFNMAISAMLIASRLSGLGMETAMIRFASSYLGVEKTSDAAQVFRTTFLVRIIVSFVLAVIIFNTAELLSTKVFHNPGLTPLFKLAAFGVLAISTWFHLKSALYAYQLFKMGVIVQNFVDFGKLSTVLVLFLYLKMTVFTAVSIFAFAPLIGVLLGFGQLYREFFSERKPIKNLFSQLFSYGKWLFVSSICGQIIPYIGIFMLAKMLSSEAAGIYGLAFNLSYIFTIINSSLNSVLLPKISRFRRMEQFETYIKGSLKISLFLVIMIIPFLFFSHNIILFFFGFRYVDSIPVFNWLLLGSIVLIINTTFKVALLSINKPHVIAMISLIKLILLVIGCYLLIPFLGVLAPAVLILIVNMCVFAFLVLYLFKQIRKGSIAFQEEEIIEPYSN